MKNITENITNIIGGIIIGIAILVVCGHYWVQTDRMMQTNVEIQ